MNNKRNLASVTRWLALRERLSTPNEREQEEQEYPSEIAVGLMEFDPEDRRPRKRS